ncbi:hypothetical protein ACFYE1_01015 [Kocuria sp. CPCC 205315]
MAVALTAHPDTVAAQLDRSVPGAAPLAIGACLISTTKAPAPEDGGALRRGA